MAGEQVRSVVFLGDGMADEPFAGLEGKTPLEAARHPNMDALASRGLFGLTRTVPQGMVPGSDTANLAVFGYDPAAYYSGRSPLEAAGMGIALEREDVTYRCNLVTLSGDGPLPEAVMTDYAAGEISTEEAAELIEFLKPRLERPGLELHEGVSYRHCLVLRRAADGCSLTPPQDIIGRSLGEYLPRGVNGALLRELTERSRALLKDHEVNRRRAARGLPPASCLWFWGEGRRPALKPFRELFGVENGAVISAVDLVRGIGVCAGLSAIRVEGATGNARTDYAAKGRAAVEAFEKGCRFVFIHVEAPDECGHRGEAEEKVRAIERIDEKIIGPVLAYLHSAGEPFSALVMPDHPTPLAKGTHTGDPVPFALFHSAADGEKRAARFTEAEAAGTGLYFDRAWELMPRLLGKE